MASFNLLRSFQRLFKLLYLKIVRINDKPQRISLGLGLGVFLGIMPGTGPIAALFLAWVLRVNRTAAFLGSLFTNTWLSIVTILLSIEVGSAILGLNQQKVYADWIFFLKDFHWFNLFKLSILEIVFPVILGYIVVAFCLGLAVYLLALIILSRIKYEDKSRTTVSR